MAPINNPRSPSRILTNQPINQLPTMPQPIRSNQFNSLTGAQKYALYVKENLRANRNGHKVGTLTKVLEWERSHQTVAQPVPLSANRQVMEQKIHAAREELEDKGAKPLSVQQLHCNGCNKNYDSKAISMIAIDCGHHTCEGCFLDIFDSHDRCCPYCQNVISGWRWMYI